MLNVDGLKQDIQQMLEDILPGTFEQALLGTFVERSKSGDKIAKEFGQGISDMLSEPIAQRLSQIIDSYIKSGVIHGTIITVGGPTTQTGVITPSLNLGNPLAGSIPNTLGIQ